MKVRRTKREKKKNINQRKEDEKIERTSFVNVRPEIIEAFQKEINLLTPKNGYLHSNKLSDNVKETTKEFIKNHLDNPSTLLSKEADNQPFVDNPQYAEMVAFAAKIHDIGKLDIDRNILLKKTRLTDAEFNKIKEHPERGYIMFKNIWNNFGIVSKEEAQLYKICKNVILQHHERGDYFGYPKGLGANEISLEAKIVAVEDSYDAMTIDRGYNTPKTPPEVKKEFSRFQNAYDKEIVDISLNLKEKALEKSMKNNLIENDENVENVNSIEKNIDDALEI